MSPQLFVKKLSALLVIAEKKGVALEKRFNRHSEKWQEGILGDICEVQMDAYLDTADALSDIIDNLNETFDLEEDEEVQDEEVQDEEDEDEEDEDEEDEDEEDEEDEDEEDEEDEDKE